jgi:hypothetical protein
MLGCENLFALVLILTTPAPEEVTVAATFDTKGTEDATAFDEMLALGKTLAFGADLERVVFSTAVFDRAVFKSCEEVTHSY